jgi:hypothetical protein
VLDGESIGLSELAKRAWSLDAKTERLVVRRLVTVAEDSLLVSAGGLSVAPVSGHAHHLTIEDRTWWT